MLWNANWSDGSFLACITLVADSEVLNSKKTSRHREGATNAVSSFGSMAYYDIGDKLGNALFVGNELLGSQNERARHYVYKY